MIVVDVEASGLDFARHSILSIGAVDFSNPLRRLYVECRAFDGAELDDNSLKINGFTRSEATDVEKPSDREAIMKFKQWAEKCNDRTLAGHNTSFDRDFLDAAARRYMIPWKFGFRTMDLHSVCYAHMLCRGDPQTKENTSALTSDEVSRYVGIPSEPKPHIAINGAIWEAEAFSRLIYARSLLKEFSGYVVPAHLTGGIGAVESKGI